MFILHLRNWSNHSYTFTAYKHSTVYEWIIYLTAIGCKPGGSVTRLQTEITYNNNNQHQQYIEQTI